ncbi:DUF1801 domain-containing protein [Cryobacterium melibiosiphilum]|nr:DUF1801 domain-containing protein [Cryobacterium melibiosiphilum]
MMKQPIPDAVEEWFSDLTPAARAVLYPVIDTLRDAMPAGYELGMFFGMPGWVVPLATYPNTVTGHPLLYVSVSAQGSSHSLYLMGLASDLEADAAFRASWAATGLALNLGAGCLQFLTLGDIDLDVVRRCVAGISVPRFLAGYESTLPAA